MNTRRHNMEYLGLNDEQYDKHVELMEMTMNEWDISLKEYVVRKSKSQGFANGDSIAWWVAEWIKSLTQD